MLVIQHFRHFSEQKLARQGEIKEREQRCFLWRRSRSQVKTEDMSSLSRELRCIRNDMGNALHDRMSIRSQGPPCACPLRQHIGGLLHKSPGGFAVTSICKLACQILLWSQGKLLSFRAPYIPGTHNIGADILSRQGLRPGNGEADMEGVRPGTSGSVCVSRDVSLSTLVLPDASSSSRTGPDFICMFFPRLLCSRES